MSSGEDFDASIRTGEACGAHELANGIAAGLTRRQGQRLLGLFAARVVKREVELNGILTKVCQDQIVACCVLRQPPDTFAACRFVVLQFSNPVNMEGDGMSSVVDHESGIEIGVIERMIAENDGAIGSHELRRGRADCRINSR